MEKHPDRVEGYTGSLEDLANSIGNLRYDALTKFFSLLAAKFKKDAQADTQRQRKLLATSLTALASSCELVGILADNVWKICKPYMKNN